MQTRAHGDVVSRKPRRENVARQARETTPTQSSTIQMAPPQLETAPPAGDETPFLAPSLPENAAIDSAAPARDLPKSVDLDARELAMGSYAAEHIVREAEEQMPAPGHTVSGVDGGVRQNSAGEADLWFKLLAGVLGVALLALLRDALKIARILHRRTQGRRVRASFETGDSRSASGVGHHTADWPPPTSTDPADGPETGLDELTRILRRVDTQLGSPKSFGPAGAEILDSLTDRRISKDNCRDRRNSEWSNAAANLIGEKT
jgi:hypothetical protein